MLTPAERERIYRTAVEQLQKDFDRRLRDAQDRFCQVSEPFGLTPLGLSEAEVDKQIERWNAYAGQK